MDASSTSSNDDDSLFDRLPRHLAAQIFDHLDLRERANARLVSQSWNEVVLYGVQLKLRMHAEPYGGWYCHYRTTKADFVQRSSSRSIAPRIAVPGASVNEQIKQLPEALMDRVFEVELKFFDGCLPAAGILTDIASSIVRPIKLYLNLAQMRLTPSVFTGSTIADASLTKEFPTIHLQSLTATFNFPTNGDFRALDYFRMDQSSNDDQYISMELRCCGRSSGELPFVVERFPQLTELQLNFGDPWILQDEVQLNAAPDWQKLPQLKNLQKLAIFGHNIKGLRAPELSKRFGLPELRSLCLYDVELPAAENLFQGAPKLNLLKYFRIELEDVAVNISQTAANIQRIARAMRNGHLKQLTDLVVDFNLEHLQMACQVVAQNSRACPAFQTLTWNDFVPLALNDPDAPSLCKALLDLPAGILGQRPFTLELRYYDWREITENEDEFVDHINAIRAAVQQSGLKRLQLPPLAFSEPITATMICDLINASHPLSATIDGNDELLRITWTHPTIEGYEQQIEVKLQRKSSE